MDAQQIEALVTMYQIVFQTSDLNKLLKIVRLLGSSDELDKTDLMAEYKRLRDEFDALGQLIEELEGYV